MKTHSQTQRNYIAEGKNQDELLKSHIQTMLGLDKSKLVESKRHTIISGPPGIGKSYTTMMAIKTASVNYIQFGAGATKANIAMKLAHCVKNLSPGEELIVLLDDADDVVFGDYEMTNVFKFAMAKDDPFYSHDVDLSGSRAKYEKLGRQDLVDAIDAFTVPGSTGIKIPTDQLRFVIICNADLEDLKLFRGKMKSSVEAIVDRVKYKRLNFEWQVSWGWLAYILQNSQPFPDHSLSGYQKVGLLNWMWDKWDKVRNPSYRTVEEMAEYMINNPNNYEDQWASLLKSKK